MLVDRDARHIAQSLRQIGIVTALNILSGNHRNICIRLQFFVGRSRRRNDGLSQ